METPIPGARAQLRNIPWWIFLGVCFHLLFFIPPPNLLPDQNVKLTSGFLCSIALLTALIANRRESNIGTPLEYWITIILIILAILSGLMSNYPIEATQRTFVLWTSCAGGFWCARIFLKSPDRRRFFINSAGGALAVILAITLFSAFYHGTVIHYIDSNEHTLAGKILLLWVGPLWLIVKGSGLRRIFGWILILVSCFIFYVSNLKIAIFIVLMLLILSAALKLISLKKMFVALLIASIPLIYFFINLPPNKRFDPGVAPIFYRVEQYFLSFKIAGAYPWFGIGLHAPRTEFIDNFQPITSSANKEEFIKQLKIIRVSENVYLTFIADMGLPFGLLYTLSLGLLIFRIIQRALEKKPGEGSLQYKLLLLPISAGAAHFLVWDGLLHPQEAWFFHILLGLGAISNVEPRQ